MANIVETAVSAGTFKTLVGESTEFNEMQLEKIEASILILCIHLPIMDLIAIYLQNHSPAIYHIPNPLQPPSPHADLSTPSPAKAHSPCSPQPTPPSPSSPPAPLRVSNSLQALLSHFSCSAWMKNQSTKECRSLFNHSSIYLSFQPSSRTSQS